MVIRSVMKAMLQRKEEVAMSMYFYDETDDWPEYQIVKDEVHRLEKEHLEISKKLRNTESLFELHPEDKDMEATVDSLKKQLKEVEEKLEKSLSLYR